MPRTFVAGRAVLAGLCLGLSACGTATVRTPRDTLLAASAAFRSHDATALRALVPPAFRASLGATSATDEATHEEHEQLADDIDRALNSGTDATVTVAAQDGTPVASLTDGVDAWGLSDGVFQQDARTPEDALRALREALRRENLGGLLAVLSSGARGTLRAEIDALVAAIGDASGPSAGARPGSGDTLEVPLRDGRRLRLVRERGQWRVELP